MVALTDLTGTVVDRYSYDAWGNLLSSSEQVPQRLRYAGYWYDQEFGWYWVGVRYYDPPLGRWVQPDPSGQDGVRTFVYVGDDPVDATDPTGLNKHICSVVVIHCDQSVANSPDILSPTLWTLDSFLPSIAAAIALPSGGSYPYESPDKKSGRPVKLKGGQGYLDKYGDRWVRDPTKPEWDVQHPDGSHTNVGPDGEITHGSNNMGRAPRNTANASRVAGAVGWAVVGTSLVWVGTKAVPTVAGWIWTGVEWLAAGVAAEAI